MSASPGFFLRHLPESVLGDACPPISLALGAASRWVHERLLDRHFTRDAQASLARDGHIFITDVLEAQQAAQLGRSLGEATFVPHHHAEYPLAIAPLGAQRDSTLCAFMRWLGSDDGVRYHAWLTGQPPRVSRVQVQCSRMVEGDFFPPHVDTWEDTLAFVYNLTFDPVEGGTLHFPDEGLTVPRLFNSVFAFHSKGRRHEVTRVQGPGRRYSVTAFYVR